VQTAASCDAVARMHVKGDCTAGAVGGKHRRQCAGCVSLHPSPRAVHLPQRGQGVHAIFLAKSEPCLIPCSAAPAVGVEAGRRCPPHLNTSSPR
jgi:hypothetical protein